MRMWDVGYLAWLGGIMLLGVALRLAGLTVHSLWFDEGCTIINSSFDSIANLWRNVIALEGGSERYQPLNIILLWCWRRMFGSSETILRLFPAVLGILSLPSEAVTDPKDSERNAKGEKADGMEFAQERCCGIKSFDHFG